MPGDLEIGLMVGTHDALIKGLQEKVLALESKIEQLESRHDWTQDDIRGLYQQIDQVSTDLDNALDEVEGDGETAADDVIKEADKTVSDGDKDADKAADPAAGSTQFDDTGVQDGKKSKAAHSGSTGGGGVW